MLLESLPVPRRAIAAFAHHSDLSSASTSSLDREHSASKTLASPNVVPDVVNPSSSSNSSHLGTSSSFGSNPLPPYNPTHHSRPPSNQPFGPSPPKTHTQSPRPNAHDSSFGFHLNLDKPVNQYSVHQFPSKLCFVMPSFAQSSTNNPFCLDGPAYAEPMLSSPFLDSHSLFNPQACLIPSDPSNRFHQPSHDDFPIDLPPLSAGLSDSNFNIPTNLPTPNLSNSSSHGITPPTSFTSLSSDLNIDDRTSRIPSPKLQSSSHTPSSDSKCGFSQHFQPRLRNPYSQSGFDLMGALAQVVNRPQPRINVGPVDASAAVVVVDARQNDLPIIFASPSFSELTGYETSEIIGQNCRFLQKPFNPSPLKKSIIRPTECPATLQIRSHIQAGREIQSSIINYRKNGQPFINLVTVIPIAWHSSDINFFVGFQADIASLTGKLGIPHGLQPPFRQPLPLLDPSKAIAALFRPKSPKPSLNQASAISLEEFSPAPTTELPLSSLSDATNLPSHYEAVLSESRDLILAISLKGTLFYVSPSCKSILGYEEEELVNGNISKLCHPGDLTGILRQLKLIGNTPHTPIDLIFRALDRHGNFFWMESQGQLHVEAGKGRKYLVVVGRPRQIGPLSWRAIRSAGGLGHDQFWMKLSLDGLCLFATMSVREVLAYEPSAMVGKSMVQLAPADEHSSIIQSIRSAYEGDVVVTFGHSLKDSNGTYVKVISDFYPSHYSSGPKACGMTLPSGKVSNPPRFIFCQINSQSSATQRAQQHPHDVPPTLSAIRSNVHDTSALGMTSEPFNQACLTTHSSGESLSEHPSTMMHGSDSAPLQPEDDLFGALGPSKTTPWNYEFSQLKRQNLKLQSEISQKGLTGRLKSKVKSSLAHRITSRAPYHPHHRSHLADSRDTAELAVESDPASLYFDDRSVLRFDRR